MLEFKVEGQKLERTDSTFVVSDSKNYLTAQFTLSEEWTGEVTAVFGNGDKFFNQPLKENKCVVPWEVIKAPFFTVSVFCGELITANTVKVMVEKSGFVCGEVPGTPTPTVWNSYLAEMAKCLETASDDLKNMFKGCLIEKKELKQNISEVSEAGENTAWQDLYITPMSDAEKMGGVFRVYVQTLSEDEESGEFENLGEGYEIFAVEIPDTEKNGVRSVVIDAASGEIYFSNLALWNDDGEVDEFVWREYKPVSSAIAENSSNAELASAKAVFDFVSKLTKELKAEMEKYALDKANDSETTAKAYADEKTAAAQANAQTYANTAEQNAKNYVDGRLDKEFELLAEVEITETGISNVTVKKDQNNQALRLKKIFVDCTLAPIDDNEEGSTTYQSGQFSVALFLDNSNSWSCWSLINNAWRTNTTTYVPLYYWIENKKPMGVMCTATTATYNAAAMGFPVNASRYSEAAEVITGISLNVGSSTLPDMPVGTKFKVWGVKE